MLCDVCGDPGPPPVKTVSDGYQYGYDAAHRVFTRSSKAPEEPRRAGARYQSVLVTDCGQVQPPEAPGSVNPVACPGAECAVGAATGYWTNAWSKRVAPDPEPVFTMRGRYCRVDFPPVPVRAVSAAAQDHVRKHVDANRPVVQPGTRTLVNYPTIVSTRDPGEVTFAIAQPLPGVVQVRPTFSWSFIGPDTSASAVGAGRPYDGTSPRTAPAGYYLTALFPHSGTATVTLTATWTGTVTVADLDPVELDPLVFTETVQLPVQQRRPVLVDPY